MLNKVTLIGRLGADPEVRTTTNGTQIANFNLATSEFWRDKTTGERQEKTEWHRVVAFGKLTEVIANYTRKGSQVYVEGKLQTRKWTDNQGNERYTTEVLIDISGKLVLLGDKGQNNNTSFSKTQSPVSEHSNEKQTESSPNAAAVDLDDDIPF